MYLKFIELKPGFFFCPEICIVICEADEYRAKLYHIAGREGCELIFDCNVKFLLYKLASEVERI